MKFTRLLARRTAPERQVVAALRGRLPARLAALPDARSAFAALVDAAVQRDLHCFALQSPFVSDGEVELLALLGRAQRRVLADTRGNAGDLPGKLLGCALLLRDAGLWLPIAQVGTDKAPRVLSATRIEQGGLARARALSLVRSGQVASTGDFVGIGISRQYISFLCKEGHLQRIRHGWYRAVPVGGDLRFHRET